MTHSALDACIWTCKKDTLDDYAEQLERLLGITLDRSEHARATVRSSEAAGLYLIATDEEEPGVCGIGLGIENLDAALQRFSSKIPAAKPHVADDVLADRGLVCAGTFVDTRIYLHEQRHPSVFDQPGETPHTRPYIYDFAWVIDPANFDHYVALTAEVLQADWEEFTLSDGRVTQAWDSGLEFIAPFPRELRPVNGELDGTTRDVHYDHLLRHGDSPWSIVIRVDDLKAAGRHAADLGYHFTGVRARGAWEKELEWYASWTHKVLMNEEIRLPEFLGLRLMIGEVTVPSEQPATV
jgi:hypothetical protein